MTVQGSEWKLGDRHVGWRCDEIKETPCEVCGILYVENSYCTGPPDPNRPSALSQVLGILRESGRL